MILITIIMQIYTVTVHMQICFQIFSLFIERGDLEKK